MVARRPEGGILPLTSWAHSTFPSPRVMQNHVVEPPIASGDGSPVTVAGAPAPAHRRPLLRVLLEIALIATGVFLGLAGDAWREREQHRDAARASLRGFRAEIAANREAVAAVRDYHAATLSSVRAYLGKNHKTRNVADVNNFWKYLARDPALLKRTWKSVKDVMAPGALDPLTKEMIYLAVSVTNGCGYCTASHGAAARKAGMTEAMFGELMSVVGMANETNRLSDGYRVPIDPAFE